MSENEGTRRPVPTDQEDQADPRPWTYYRARLAGLGRDPEGNAAEIEQTRRLMVWSQLRQRASALGGAAAAAGLGRHEREELARLVRWPGSSATGRDECRGGGR